MEGRTGLHVREDSRAPQRVTSQSNQTYSSTGSARGRLCRTQAEHRRGPVEETEERRSATEREGGAAVGAAESPADS